MAREVFNMEKYLQESESLIIDLSNKLHDALSAVIEEEQKKRGYIPLAAITAALSMIIKCQLQEGYNIDNAEIEAASMKIYKKIMKNNKDQLSNVIVAQDYILSTLTVISAKDIEWNDKRNK